MSGSAIVWFRHDLRLTDNPALATAIRSRAPVVALFILDEDAAGVQLDSKYIHKPWEAPEDVLCKARVKLGETYPRSMVDHAKARKRALEAFAKMCGEEKGALAKRRQRR